MTADTTREQAIEAIAHEVCGHGGHLPNRDRSLPGSCAFHERMAGEYVDALAAAGLLVLSPKDEPTARLDGGKPHERIITGLEAIVGSSDLENWPEARDIIHDAISELSFEPSQPNLDPLPFFGVSVKYGEFRGSDDSLFPGQMRFAPRPEFSQVESQYPHRKA